MSKRNRRAAALKNSAATPPPPVQPPAETPPAPAASPAPAPQQQVVQPPQIVPVTLYAVQDAQNTSIVVQAAGDKPVVLFTYPRLWAAMARSLSAVAVGGLPPIDSHFVAVDVRNDGPKLGTETKETPNA